MRSVEQLMGDRYCDVVGYKVPDSECAEIKAEKFHECDDCPSQAGQEVKDIMGEGKRKYTMSAAALKARREAGEKPKKKKNKDGDTPEVVPCCSECGIKCTEAETFDIKMGLCGGCKDTLPTFPPLQGVKHDSDKLRYDLVPPEALEEIVKGLTFGAAKYTDRNWEKGINYGRVYGAMMRHMQAFWRGEDVDHESGLSHLSHAGCCLFFLLTYDRREMVGFDDRPSKECEE